MIDHDAADIIDAIDFIRRNTIRDFHSIEDEIQFEDDI